VWTIAKLADVQADVRATRFAFRDGKMAPVPAGKWRSLVAEGQFDAALYLALPAAMRESQPDPKLCKEPGYVELRLHRIALAGLPPVEANRVNELCGESRK
jgi:hypothetical protein